MGQELKTDDEQLPEHGWSELAREAFRNSSKYSESAPSTLKAAWCAHYIPPADPRQLPTLNGFGKSAVTSGAAVWDRFEE